MLAGLAPACLPCHPPTPRPVGVGRRHDGLLQFVGRCLARPPGGDGPVERDERQLGDARDHWREARPEAGIHLGRPEAVFGQNPVDRVAPEEAHLVPQQRAHAVGRDPHPRPVGLGRIEEGARAPVVQRRRIR